MIVGLRILLLLLIVAPVEAQILTVPNGGTGQGTLPVHGPIVGNGTAAVNSISPGTAGQCLISGGPNVDPVFAPCPGSAGGSTPGGILGYPQSYGSGAVFAGVLTELIVDNFAGATIDAKIAAAQAALPANGGILTLSCTNYPNAAGSISLSKNNITLRGCGGSSIVNSNGATILNFPAGVTGIIVTGTNVTVEKISLVSVSSSLGTDDGIQLSNGQPKVSQVSVTHFGRHGINFIDQTDLWTIDNINSQSNYGDGFHWNSPCTDNNVGVSIRTTARGNGGWGYNLACGFDNQLINSHSDNNTLGAGSVGAAYNTFSGFYTETSGPLVFTAQAMYNRIWVHAFGQPNIQDNAPQGSNEIFYTAATGEGNYPAQTVFRLTTKPNAAAPFAVETIVGASLATPDMIWRDQTNGVNLLDYAPSTGWKFLRPVTIGMANSGSPGTLSIASGSTIYSTSITTQATTANTQFNLPPDNGANGSCLITNGAGNTSWSSSCGGATGSMTYPGQGIANSVGTAGPWGTSYSATNQIPANFIASPLTQSTTGNAATATALANTPTQCTTAGTFATGIAANGNANCAAGGGSTVTVPGAAGDLLFSTGSGAMQVDSGNVYYDLANKILYAPAIQVNSALDGYVSYVSGAGILPALPANSMGFSAPPTGGTAGLMRLPGTLAAGALTLGAPGTLNGVNQSQVAVTPIATTATTPNALVQTNSGGTIDPSFITGGVGGGGNVSAVPTPLQYEIPMWNSATTIAGITAGASGYVLTSNGTTAAPSWQPSAGGPGGGASFPVVTLSATGVTSVTAAQMQSCTVFVVSGSSPTIQLPTPAPASGCIWVINYGTGSPALTRAGSEMINGSLTSYTFPSGSSGLYPFGLKVVSTGAGYVIQPTRNGTFTQLASGTATSAAFVIGTTASITAPSTNTGNNGTVNGTRWNNTTSTLDVVGNSMATVPPPAANIIASGTITADVGMVAPQFTVNPTPPPPASPFAAQNAPAARNVGHTSAVRVLSPNNNNYLDIDVPDSGNPSITSSTGTVTVSGLGGGPGGPTSVSDLTAATKHATIPFGQYHLTFNFDTRPPAQQGQYLFQVNETAANTTPWPNNQELMSISTALGSTTAPLGIYTGTGYWLFSSTDQQLQARGTAKFAGPIILTTAGNPGTPIADAPALGTDANGNIVAKSGGGAAATPLYSRAFPALTVNLPNGQVYNLSAWGPECVVVGWCVMATPSEDATYSFGFEMVVTANGSNCTALTLAVHLAFTPADPPSAVQIVTTMAVRNLNASSVLLTAANLSGAPLNTLYGDIQGVPVEFRAKAGTNVSFRLLQGTYTCDGPPVITFRPVLRGPLGY